MAGYTNNYAGYDDPEYQTKPNADSTNGTYGANTPAARQNQQDNASRARGGQTDPYADFAQSSRNWYPRQVPPPAPVAPPATQAPQSPETALSSLLRGKTSSAPPVTPMPIQQVPVNPLPQQTVDATVQSSAQPSGVAPPPAMPPQFPQLPDVIPPVPVMLGTTPPSQLATTLRATTLSSDVAQPGDTTTQPPPANTASASGATIQTPPPVVGPSTATPTPGDAGPTIATPPPVVGPSTATPPPATDSTRGRAVSQGPQFTDQQLADIYKSGQPFSPSQQAILDQRNPRPSSTDDPAAAAKWYQGFAFIDPRFANITEADVNNQRALAVSGAFKDNPQMQDIGRWFLAGKPGGQFTPTDPNARPTIANHDPGGGSDLGNRPLNFDPRTGAPLAGTSGGPPATPPPATPPVTPPTGPTTPPTSGANNPDLITQERGLYDPLFRQQQSELARTLRAQAALDGSVNSGGFNESLGRAESNLSANQGAQLASLTEAERNRQQAMTIAVMQDATQRFGIKTNDDLQRWLNDPNNNTLQKYGIDKNDLLERYKAELGLSGSQAIAGASFNAAALSAATQAAIAAGNNATQLKLGGMQNDLGFAQLQGNLFNSDEDRRLAELKMLSDAGLSQAAITQILQSFGPKPPVFTLNP